MTALRKTELLPEDISELLSRVSYRPRTQFQLLTERNVPWTTLVISMFVTDSDNLEQQSWVHMKHPIPPLKDERSFYSWLRHTLHICEMHEADEFFKVDGIKLFDPHRSNT
jgi:hypothetical protein